jgi:hypothetical protein
MKKDSMRKRKEVKKKETKTKMPLEIFWKT